MSISIIIPFFDEEESVEAVLDELLKMNLDAEIIAVDDGSCDNTAGIIQKHFDVRLISLGRNLGQSAALYAGLKHARSEVCVMMDGDGQNDPADIPKLLSMLEDADVVCGYRAVRRDSASRRAASWIANRIRRAFLHDNVRDTGCTMKALRTADVRYLLPFNGLHRFLPVFLSRAGLGIVEVPVNHRPRRHGKSKYSMAGRAVAGLYDLIGVGWLLSRQIPWPTQVKIDNE